MKTKLKMLVWVAVAALSTNCSKEGPAGPAGPTGNANVIGTNVVNIDATYWYPNSTSTLWTAQLNTSGITQAIIDKGSVQLFFNINGSEWSSIPITVSNYSLSYSFGLGYLKVYAQKTDLSTLSNPGNASFRIVVISASNKMSHPNTNWSDYKQVEKALGIKF